MDVFLLQHLHLPGDCEEVKVCGIFETRSDAESAALALADKEGFRDHPRIVDPEVDDDPEGFYVDSYTLGEIHWADSFFTPEERRDTSHRPSPLAVVPRVGGLDAD